MPHYREFEGLTQERMENTLLQLHSRNLTYTANGSKISCARLEFYVCSMRMAKIALM